MRIRAPLQEGAPRTANLVPSIHIKSLHCGIKTHTDHCHSRVALDYCVVSQHFNSSSRLKSRKCHPLMETNLYHSQNQRTLGRLHDSQCTMAWSRKPVINATKPLANLAVTVIRYRTEGFTVRTTSSFARMGFRDRKFDTNHKHEDLKIILWNQDIHRPLS